MSDHLFNFHDTILLATGFQSAIFIVLILLVKHERCVSDFFLVGFFLAQIAIPVHTLITYNLEIRPALLTTQLYLFHIFDIAHWLEGPLLFWYTRSVLLKKFSLAKWDYLYLLPAVVYCVYIYFAFHSIDTSDKLTYLAQEYNISEKSTVIQQVVISLRDLLRMLFGVLCFVYIRQARMDLRDRFSNIEKIDFGWLSTLIIAFITIHAWILIVVFTEIFAPNLGGPIFNVMGLAGNYLTFTLITTLMFLSLQRSTLFDGQLHHDIPSKQPEKTNLDPDLAEKIQRHMAQEKPYLLHLLNLQELASQLEMHPRALSLAIKANFETNFYEFVNSYRIEEAKTILSDSNQKHKTMIQISEECGFNSKATFNSFFKKLVGMTPTKYKYDISSS